MGCKTPSPLHKEHASMGGFGRISITRIIESSWSLDRRGIC